MVGKLEPLTVLTLQMVKGRKELDYFQQARLAGGFPSLREDLVCLVHATYLLHLVRDGVEKDQPVKELYQTLLHLLHCLKEGRPGPLVRWFELYLAGQLGVEPELERCLGCGSEKVGHLSPESGGVVCLNCRSKDAISLGPAALAALRYLQRCAPQAAGRISLEGSAARQAETVLASHLAHHWPSSRRFPRLAKELLA